jgi:hypothetical protein
LYNVIKDKEGYFNHSNDPEFSGIRDRLYGFLKKGYPNIDRSSH